MLISDLTPIAYRCAFRSYAPNSPFKNRVRNGNFTAGYENNNSSLRALS
jgi:hypothetical protein